MNFTVEYVHNFKTKFEKQSKKDSNPCKRDHSYEFS